MRTVSLYITEELAGRKVKSLLRGRLHIPEHMIARIKLRETGICLNGVRCRTTDPVRVGDLLTAEVGDVPAETGIIPLPMKELRIAYEDEDLLVMDKPAGMATHGKALRLNMIARDAEASLLLRFADTAWYCAVYGNQMLLTDPVQRERRREAFSMAISALNKMRRPLFNLFSIGSYSNREMQEWVHLLNESTRLIVAVQSSDGKRAG